MAYRTLSFTVCTLLGALVFNVGHTARAAVVSVPIPSDIVTTTTPLADPGLNVLWDVNGDGTNDFNFSFRQPQIAGDVDWQASVFPLGNSRIIGTFDNTGDVFNATGLTLGTTVSNASTFTGASPVQGILGEIYAGTPGGQFTAAGRYLGFSLLVGTNTYYGWLSVRVARGTGGGTPGIDFITAAYNNTAGGAVITGQVPEPGTWALMGLGVVAIATARLRRRTA